MNELDSTLDDPWVRKAAASDILLPAAWSLRDQGKDAEAEKLFRRALACSPDSDEARDVLLNLYASDNERASQLELRDRAWANVLDPMTLMTEGVTRLAAGDAASAYPLLKKAASELPESEIAWFNLGLAALKMERWEEARAAMARAVRIRPEFANAHLNLGGALQKLGRCSEAVPELRQALSLRPDLKQAHAYLFHCYRAWGDTARAEEHLRLSKDDAK